MTNASSESPRDDSPRTSVPPVALFAVAVVAGAWALKDLFEGEQSLLLTRLLGGLPVALLMLGMAAVGAWWFLKGALRAPLGKILALAISALTLAGFLGTLDRGGGPAGGGLAGHNLGSVFLVLPEAAAVPLAAAVLIGGLLLAFKLWTQIGAEGPALAGAGGPGAFGGAAPTGGVTVPRPLQRGDQGGPGESGDSPEQVPGEEKAGTRVEEAGALPPHLEAGDEPTPQPRSRRAPVLEGLLREDDEEEQVDEAPMPLVVDALRYEGGQAPDEEELEARLAAIEDEDDAPTLFETRQDAAPPAGEEDAAAPAAADQGQQEEETLRAPAGTATGEPVAEEVAAPEAEAGALSPAGEPDTGEPEDEDADWDDEEDEELLDDDDVELDEDEEWEDEEGLDEEWEEEDEDEEAWNPPAHEVTASEEEEAKETPSTAGRASRTPVPMPAAGFGEETGETPEVPEIPATWAPWQVASSAEEAHDESGERQGSLFPSQRSSEDGDLHDRAVELVIREDRCSVVMLQRHLRIPYSEATALIERMHEEGVVGPQLPSGRREILVTPEQAEQLLSAET